MGKEAPLKREGQGGPTRASREATPLRAPVHPGGRGNSEKNDRELPDVHPLHIRDPEIT